MSGPSSSAVQPLTPHDPREVGPYALAGRLGAGGMGVVYAGLDSAGRHVAIKVIRPEHAADRDFRKRFSREVALLKRVRGASVPPVLAADTGAEQPWLVTPYVPGPTLDGHIARRGPLRGTELLGLAAGLAEALVAIHKTGVVHRDLKPANIILSPSGPQVLDLGIATAADDSALTRTGMLVGSPGWISPEQYLGQKAGPAGDVFAWGALVVFAATGRPPFGTGRHEVLAFRVMQDEADLDGVPEELRDLVTRALAKDPAVRPSARELLEVVTQRWSALADGTPTRLLDRTRPLTSLMAGTAPVTRLMEREWTSFAAAAPAWAVPSASGRGAGRASRRGTRGRRRVLMGTTAAATVIGLAFAGVTALKAGQDGSGGEDRRSGTPSVSQNWDDGSGTGNAWDNRDISVPGPNGPIHIKLSSDKKDKKDNSEG